MLTGFINLLKPPGFTSHDVVQALRRLLNEKRIGHGGTLDPLACGVLPIAIGKATRLLEYIQSEGKTYRVEFLLGLRTDTQDISGRVLSSRDCSHISYEELQKAANLFTGEIQQTPPMFSAVHYKGRRLYELARQGVEVERPSRTVTIHKFKIIKWWRESPYIRVLADVSCSKGTYIRTLGDDWGNYLGCGATMTLLIRSKSGVFEVGDSWTLEEIKYCIEKEKWNFILPLTTGISFMPRVIVTKEKITSIINGVPISLIGCEELSKLELGDLVRIENSQGKLLAVGIVENKNNELCLKPKKVFK